MKSAIQAMAISAVALAPQIATAGVAEVDLAFVTHLDMELAEQDVYIVRDDDSGHVFRPTRGDHDLDAPLYAAAESVPHDPFNADALGPFPKGEALGITLGDWLRHSGTGRYRCENGTGSLDLSFGNLVPNGVYTMWHAFLPATPPVPFTGTLDLPLGAPDGSDGVFVADSNGDARFVRKFSPCLQMSDDWTVSALAINWHSDGRTWAGHPGPFGLTAHIPLVVMLPRSATD